MLKIKPILTMDVEVKPFKISKNYIDSIQKMIKAIRIMFEPFNTKNIEFIGIIKTALIDDSMIK
jgi:fatty acid-binding protein DegV